MKHSKVWSISDLSDFVKHELKGALKYRSKRLAAVTHIPSKKNAQVYRRTKTTKENIDFYLVLVGDSKRQKNYIPEIVTGHGCPALSCRANFLFFVLPCLSCRAGQGKKRCNVTVFGIYSNNLNPFFKDFSKNGWKNVENKNMR
jgi:hypothetical protein